MRLRYLHLRQYPPINDMTVRFAGGSPLQRECAIRFVVGLNGSGKSNLLRAVAEVFIALADGRLPMFPVRLIYELGERGSAHQRTLILDCMEERASASLWMGENYICPDDATAEQFVQVFECLRTNSPTIPPEFRPLIARGEWPSGAVTPTPIALPSAVLAYATGDIKPWQSVWSRNQDAEGAYSGSNDDYDFSDERPSGWTPDMELSIPSKEIVESLDKELEPPFLEASPDDFVRPILITKELLKCAFLVVALLDATNSNEKSDPDVPNLTGQRALLKESMARGGWQELVSVAFRCRLRPDAWNDRMLKAAHDWCLCAGEVVAEPYPDYYTHGARYRTLHFDLRGQFSGQNAFNKELLDCASQGEALLQLLGGRNEPPFKLFKRLTTLHYAGLFDDVELHLRRQNRPDNLANISNHKKDAGVMHFEELSDGEKMVLGRLALLHLLEGQQDSLLLLDEPETHFNDLWKRDIVSVVDGALGKTSCEVVIATHAALVLTDALKDELVVLECSGQDDPQKRFGTVVRALDADIHTFGATGDHPLRDIFGAPDTVGRRASRLLEVLIAAASIADRIDPQWENQEQTLNEEVIRQVLAIASEAEQGLTIQSVQDSLVSIQHFALHFGAKWPLRMKAVLETFIQQTGPGYFQVELKRAWHRLLGGTSHVA
jgi:predicted ATPase